MYCIYKNNKVKHFSSLVKKIIMILFKMASANKNNLESVLNLVKYALFIKGRTIVKN